MNFKYLTLILLFSVNIYALAKSENDSNKNMGIDYFTSIVFGYGIVADRLPLIKENIGMNKYLDTFVRQKFDRRFFLNEYAYEEKIKFEITNEKIKTLKLIRLVIIRIDRQNDKYFNNITEVFKIENLKYNPRKAYYLIIQMQKDAIQMIKEIHPNVEKTMENEILIRELINKPNDPRRAFTIGVAVAVVAGIVVHNVVAVSSMVAVVIAVAVKVATSENNPNSPASINGLPNLFTERLVQSIWEANRDNELLDTLIRKINNEGRWPYIRLD